MDKKPSPDYSTFLDKKFEVTQEEWNAFVPQNQREVQSFI